MTTGGGGSDRADVTSNAVVVLTSLFEPAGDQDDDSWRRLGSLGASFFCFRLLHALLERALGTAAQASVPAYARDAHGRSPDPAPPRWLIEAVCRATLGEAELVGGIDPDDLFQVGGLLIRDLVGVLALPDGELADLIDRVARLPVPAELAEPS